MKHYLSLILLSYLRLFARLQLAKNHHAVVVGVTGSSGKSSTVEAVALALSTKGRVKQTSGGNSESGIPLDILGLHATTYTFLDWLRLAILAPLRVFFYWPHFDYYVVEMGVDSPKAPKNMTYLLSIVHPEVGIVLSAGLVHGASFDHLVQDRDPTRRVGKIIDLIAREKMQLLSSLPPTGLAIYNQDQKELQNYAKGIVARRLTIGHHKGASLRVKSTLSRRGFVCQVNYLHHNHILVLPDYLESGYESTFASALAVAYGLHLPIEPVLAKLSNYRAPAGRLRTFTGVRRMTLLDSSYNASPATMQSCLSLLARLGKGRHRVAIVGDMRELGRGSKVAHKQLGEWLMRSCDEAILFGYETKLYTLPLLESHHFPARHFDRMQALSAYTTTSLPEGSLVLVKGSQNTIYLERAVEALLLDPSDIASLCRRGRYWDSLRSQAE